MEKDAEHTCGEIGTNLFIGIIHCGVLFGLLCFSGRDIIMTLLPVYAAKVFFDHRRVLMIDDQGR
jgi:hypothetical protein